MTSFVPLGNKLFFAQNKIASVITVSICLHFSRFLGDDSVKYIVNKTSFFSVLVQNLSMSDNFHDAVENFRDVVFLKINASNR
jgi:hypothetical protein